MSDRLISVKEAKERLGVGTNTVYNLMNANELRFIKMGRRTLISENEIQAFIQRKLEEATAV